MNWLPLTIALGLSVLAGAWLSARLRMRKPLWSLRRRVLTAAVPLPAIILLATMAGAAWYLAGSSENMRDLAVAVVIGLGSIFGVVTLAGGLIGAAMVERNRKA